MCLFRNEFAWRGSEIYSWLKPELEDKWVSVVELDKDNLPIEDVLCCHKNSGNFAIGKIWWNKNAKVFAVITIRLPIVISNYLIIEN